MPTLILRFPGGRYHATPHGHHVNEGLVEWPPSPWRLLRGLIACGYSSQGWSEVPPVGRRLIENLASRLPRYRLPPASVAHSRHYMPILEMAKGREKTTLVFDTWAYVGDGALAVRWDCTLDDAAARLFEVLARNLGYLGRSESWVLTEAVSDDIDLPVGSESFPHLGDRPAGPGWEQVSLMAPELPEAYAAWRERSVEAALKGLALPEGKQKPTKKLEKDRRRAVAPYPRDLIDCLQKDTSWWKGHRWSQPPGSRRVVYWRRADALSVGPPMRAFRGSPAPVTALLLALTTPSGSRSALPPCTRTLQQAELIHRALVGRAGRGRPVDCPELTGKDDLQKPIKGHRHAHLLPLDLDGDGHLDHILIHAPMGLGAAAQRAVRGLRRTWTKGGIGDLQLALAGQGHVDDLRRLPPPLRDGVAAVLGPPSGARVWRSITPLVLPRYQKRSGANAIEGQVLAELASRGLPPAIVEVLPWDDETRPLRHYARVRRHPAPPPPIDAGLAIRLTFDNPIRGPLALGYASHFGLGLFAAEAVGLQDSAGRQSCGTG
jgi:CRISPR-associated protein Csb2